MFSEGSSRGEPLLLRNYIPIKNFLLDIGSLDLYPKQEIIYRRFLIQKKQENNVWQKGTLYLKGKQGEKNVGRE